MPSTSAYLGHRLQGVIDLQWLKALWADESGDLIEDLAVVLIVMLSLTAILGGVAVALSRAGHNFERRIHGVSIGG